ncbi:hypothetical protein [Enterovibrio nigricans]|uniref:Uncharacterized protein n=1 Tax=Enterovibrio nigricans DSM 22720 TaxID=1121868 RepID=A0A1T4UIB0_9GAMM|nr:hypothetical protein [Enterovibrio nigricans]PKF50433.1 hypothetical protein AT251_11705 [Enterovibrio nigricans]SKA52413.1 hypothetical protein SAMN02745132_01810 [Enterovibrio nigricans DSM 22720]
MPLKELIPNFVKAMGHRVVSYILNVSESEARQVLQQQFKLSLKQKDTLASYIQLCRQMRAVAVSQGDIEQSFFHRLPHVLHGNHHIFTVWHKQNDGRVVEPKVADPLSNCLAALAVDLYPLFLVKAGTRPHLFYRASGYLSAAISHLPGSKALYRQVLEDLSFERIFEVIGNSPSETYGHYADSNGRRGVITLASLPAAILINSYDLMRIRGPVSLNIFVDTVLEMLEIARSVADGEVAQIPLFVGFRNASLTHIDELETKWGTLRRYTPAIAEYVLQIPSQMAKRKDSGFMLESGFAYAVNSGDLLDDDDWPDEVQDAENEQASTELNITLCMAMCFFSESSPFVAPEWVWRIDPFSLESAKEWVDTVQEAEYPLEITDGVLNDLENWSLRLEDTDSRGIRIAFSRLFCAARQPDKLDGLLDSILALRNLFAAGSDVKRVSEGVGALVIGGSDEAVRLAEMLEEDWTLILSGEAWWDGDEIREKTLSCISLCLTCLHHIYLKYPTLISDPERLDHIIALQAH